MEQSKLKEVFNDTIQNLVENEALLEDMAQLGLNLIISAWSSDPNREEIREKYGEWFLMSFMDISERIIEKEKDKKE